LGFHIDIGDFGLYHIFGITQMIPEGYLYFSSSSKWSVVPVFGFNVLNNGVIWIRRI
jgi:hypothetical protein